MEKKATTGKRFLILDGTNLAYMSYFNNTGLSYKGKPTSVIYGVISSIRSLTHRLHADKVLICWDGRKHPERLKMLPTYKGHRAGRMTPEEKKGLITQMETTRKMLHLLGFTQYHCPDIEGDDMIYMTCRKVLRQDESNKVVIVSMDKDFNQLISDRVYTYNPKTNAIITPQFLSMRHFGLKPFQVFDFYLFLGDSSDDIPGYKGIGEVKASQFLKQHLTIQHFLNNPEKEFRGIDRKELKKFYKLARFMRDLPYFYRKVLKPNGVKPKRYGKHSPDLAGFSDMCREYGIRSFLSEKEQILITKAI